MVMNWAEAELRSAIASMEQKRAMAEWERDFWGLRVVQLDVQLTQHREWLEELKARKP